MMNILLGLNHCHDRKIMHRDLKPENLIIKDKNNLYDLKLIDFGLASFSNVDQYLFQRCGTPGYVAPEVINNRDDEKYDEKVDIFSAGVIFYVL